MAGAASELRGASCVVRFLNKNKYDSTTVSHILICLARAGQTPHCCPGRGSWTAGVAGAARRPRGSDCLVGGVQSYCASCKAQVGCLVCAAGGTCRLRSLRGRALCRGIYHTCAAGLSCLVPAGLLESSVPTQVFRMRTSRTCPVQTGQKFACPASLSQISTVRLHPPCCSMPPLAAGRRHSRPSNVH